MFAAICLLVVFFAGGVGGTVHPPVRQHPVRTFPHTSTHQHHSASLPPPAPDTPIPVESHALVDPPSNNTIGNLDLIIVYNGYIYPKREKWLELMSGQLDELNCNGMAHKAKDIYISLTIDSTSESNKQAASLVKETIATFSKILPKAKFDVTLENRYEYPGLRTMWDVAHTIPKEDAQRTIFVYFHAKGMVNTRMPSGFHDARTPLEVNLFHRTFDPWMEVLERFGKQPEINKAGCYPGPEGHIWYNFYYARASYVQRLVNPTISTNRFYYESWIRFIDNEHYWPTNLRHIEFVEKNIRRPSTTNSGCGDCWSIVSQSLGQDFNHLLLESEEQPKLRTYDWYKCRNETVLPRQSL